MGRQDCRTIVSITSSCIAPKADKRPANAAVLVEQVNDANVPMLELIEEDVVGPAKPEKPRAVVPTSPFIGLLVKRLCPAGAAGSGWATRGRSPEGRFRAQAACLPPSGAGEWCWEEAMRKRLLLFGLVVALVVVACIGAWLLWPDTAITPENAEKIVNGMTLTDVEAILGGPPRDETGGAVIADLGKFDELTPSGNPHHAWQSDRVLVFVWMGADGRVANFIAFRQQRREEGSLDMLRGWLRI